jgi:hypothetical protein
MAVIPAAVLMPVPSANAILATIGREHPSRDIRRALRLPLLLFLFVVFVDLNLHQFVGGRGDLEPVRRDAMRGALLDAIKIMAATATAFMVVLQMNSL